MNNVDHFDEARPDVSTWLQSWYVAQCDDDWEHGAGISIETLDNPGWSVRIDLDGTALEDVPYAGMAVHRSEDDWCTTQRDGRTFQAACGPTNLGEGLHEFRRWVTAAASTTAL